MAQQSTQQSAQLNFQNITQPMVQPIVHQFVPPNTSQPMRQPMAQPMAQPIAHQFVPPNTSQPMRQPMAQPMAQPIAHQFVPPNTSQPMVQPMVQPMAQPMVQQKPLNQKSNQPKQKEEKQSLLLDEHCNDWWGIEYEERQQKKQQPKQPSLDQIVDNEIKILVGTYEKFDKVIADIKHQMEKDKTDLKSFFQHQFEKNNTAIDGIINTNTELAQRVKEQGEDIQRYQDIINDLHLQIDEKNRIIKRKDGELHKLKQTKVAFKQDGRKTPERQFSPAFRKERSKTPVQAFVPTEQDIDNAWEKERKGIYMSPYEKQMVNDLKQANTEVATTQSGPRIIMNSFSGLKTD
jgi:hypothetical protein